MAKAKETKPKEDKPKAAKQSVSLDDLSNDPSVIQALTPKEAGALYDEAEKKGVVLAGSALRELYYRSIEDHTPATKEAQATAKAAADGQALAN